MIELVCASANPDKVVEIAALLDGVARLLPRPPEVPDVVEDADSLEGNARLKASAICAASGQRHLAQQFGHHVVGADAFTLRLIAQSQPVAQNIRRYGPYVFWVHIVAAAQPGMGAPAAVESQRSTG